MIKRYEKFIESRKRRVIPEGTYTENHHINPRSWGGEDSNDNLIRLTAREHFIAHKMLYRESKDKSMAHAFRFICFTNLQSGFKITSRDLKMAHLCASGENNPMYGSDFWKTLDEERHLDIINRNRQTNIDVRSQMSDDKIELMNKKNSINCRKAVANRSEQDEDLRVQKLLKSRGKRLKVTNLLTGEVRIFKNGTDESLVSYLQFNSKVGCRNRVSEAINNKDGKLTRMNIKYHLERI